MTVRNNGRWRIKSSRIIYENDFFSLSVDDVVDPDGRDSEFSTIKFRDSVVVAALDQNDDLILTKQFRYALGKTSIEFAAGAIDEEAPIAAAQRELREELGIEAASWTDLGVVDANPSMTNDRKYLFLARDLTFGKPERESTEDIELYRIPFAKAFQMVGNGQITHDITYLLILRVGEVLKYEQK